MPIILRKTKEAPLTIEELDGNFADLDSRINQLNETISKTASLATIERRDGELWFISKTGEVIADIKMPELTAPEFVKLSVYDRSNLPGRCKIGQICVFLDRDHTACVIFFDGEKWLKVMDNQPLV